MCKFIKKLFVIGATVCAVVGAAAGIYYFLTRKNSEANLCDCEDDFEEEEFDEDFDLDTQERSYVSLTPAPQTENDSEEAFTFTDNTPESDDTPVVEATPETVEEFFDEDSES